MTAPPPRPASAPRPPGEAPGAASESLTARTLGGFAWTLAAAAAQALLALVVLMALSRLLTPADFGLFAAALVFLRLAESLGRQCVGLALVQRLDLTRRHVETGFALAPAGGVALAAALWAAAPLIAGWLALPELRVVLEALAPVAAVTGLGIVSESLLRRDLRFRRLAVAGVASRIAGNGLAALTLALLGFGVWALVWGVVLREVLFTAAVIASRPPSRPRLLRREAAELLRTGTGFWAIHLFNLAARDGVRLVVARALGAAPLGLFTRSTALALGTARLGPVLRDVLIPALARRQHRARRVEAVYLNGVELLALVALPLGAMAALAAREVVAVVLGGQWEAAAPVLAILAPAGALHACGAMNDSVVRAMGAAWRETWRRALCCALLGAGAWWGSRWGLGGVAVAVACAWVLAHLLMSQLACALLGVPWRSLAWCYVPALWVAMCAAAALWTAAGEVREAGLPVAAELALALAAWAAGAAAAAYWAPPFARPRFAGWLLAQAAFDRAGRAGSIARAVLGHAARRWDRGSVVAPDAAGGRPGRGLWHGSVGSADRRKHGD